MAGDTRTRAQLMEALAEAGERASMAEIQAKAAQASLASMEGRFSALETRLNETVAADEPTPIRDDEKPSTNGKDATTLARAFVCPQGPNSEILIKVGAVQRIPDPNSPRGYRDFAREGDIKVKFHGGVWQTGQAKDEHDALRITWLEGHPEIARDVMDPMTGVWFELKSGQMETSRREAAFSKTADIDAALKGDFSQLSSEGGIVVQQAREQVETANAGV
ncbi:MAG: hypothetical protein IIC90_08590 [Chloroflexi bacterium]|nr:hypothetical protein [Chloroflexota bacterium]